MDHVLIVSYELTNPVINQEALTQRLKNLGSWARLTNSTYLIATKYDSVQVRDHLWEVMQQTDKIYVGVAPAPSAWDGMPNDVSQWILKNQKP